MKVLQNYCHIYEKVKRDCSHNHELDMSCDYDPGQKVQELFL